MRAKSKQAPIKARGLKGLCLLPKIFSFHVKVVMLILIMPSSGDVKKI
jgi:hypothetical protein